MAIALVSHVAATGSNFTTGSINTTGATLLVANNSNFGGTPGISDSYNNTWIPFTQRGGNNAQRMHYCINPVVGTGHTFTVTDGNVGSLQVAAFSGVTGVLPFDQASGAASAGSSTAQPGSLTPANANSLMICGLGFQNAGTLSGINSGFTITDTSPASGIYGGSLAYLIQTTAVAENPTWTFSGSLLWGTEMAVFIAGSTTPPTSPALVAHVKLSNSGNPYTATSGSIDTTGATILIANVWGGFGGSGVLTDSKSNTWTALTLRSQGGSIEQKLYYAVNPTVGSGHTFTITTGHIGGAEIAAFSGIQVTSPFDVEAGAGIAPAISGQPGAVTPASANSLIISAGIFSTTGVLTPKILGVDLGFSIIDKVTPTSNIYGGAMAWIAQGTAAAINPTWYVQNAVPMALESAVFKYQAPATNISVPAVAMVTASYAPAVALDAAVPLGSLVVTTYGPALSISTPVPLGTLGLASFAPAVAFGENVPVGSAAIASFAPALTFNTPIPVGVLAFSTYAPTLGSLINIAVPLGTLALLSFLPAVTISIAVPVGTLAFTTYIPVNSNMRIHVPVGTLGFTGYAPVSGGVTTLIVPVGALHFATYAPRVVIGDISGCAERFGPKLYYWEPSYLERPEDTFLRATDWDNGDYQGLKFVQGFILEADTEGATRTIKIQGDQSDIETISINHPGQVMKPYSLNQPVQKHLLRILPTDLTAHWRLFGVKWVFEPAPEFAKEWKTQGTDHDIPGYQFLKDAYIAHNSTVDITLNITIDNNVFTYIIPNSGGVYVKSYLLLAIAGSGLSLKGTLFTYELTSSAPFQLFRKDCEVRVHAWSGGSYMVKLPFGDIHRTAGARI